MNQNAAFAGLTCVLLLSACGGNTNPPPGQVTSRRAHYVDPALGDDQGEGGETIGDRGTTGATSSPSPLPPVNPPAPQKINEAQDEHLLCNINGECNPALAMIAIAKDRSVERCSGFLISEDEVITNDHCISHTVAAGGECRGVAFIHFAAAPGMQEQHAGCDRVEYRSHENGIATQDFAILKLDRKITDRSPLRLSARGFAANERATIYRVQMASAGRGSLNGIQTKTECDTSYHTLLYPSADHARSTLMTFTNCLVSPGNSGSPVLNQDGEVGAVIQGFLQVRKGTAIANELDILSLDGVYEQVNVGSQVSCMKALFPEQAALCSAAVPLKAVSPDLYLKDEAFPRTMLPSGGSGTWKLAKRVEVSAKQKARLTYVKTPSCVQSTSTSITLDLMRYEEGLNKSYLAEWRALDQPGDASAKFQVRVKYVGQVPSGTILTSTGIGTVNAPICTSGARLTRR